MVNICTIKLVNDQQLIQQLMNSALVGYEELSRSSWRVLLALVDNRPSEICLILHILRKPNSLIAFYYLFKIIPSLKAQLKHAFLIPASMLSLSSIVYVLVCPALQIFSANQQMSPSKLSSCCFCHFLAIISPSYSCSSYS